MKYLTLIFFVFNLTSPALSQDTPEQCQSVLDSAILDVEFLNEVSKISAALNSSAPKKRWSICDPRQFNLCELNSFFNYEKKVLDKIGCKPNSHFIEFDKPQDVNGTEAKYVRIVHGLTCNGNKLFLYFDKDGKFIDFHNDAKFKLRKLAHFELSPTEKKQVTQLATEENEFLTTFNKEVGHLGFSEQEKWLTKRNLILPSTETILDGTFIASKSGFFSATDAHNKDVNSFVRQALWSTAIIQDYAVQTSNVIKKGKFSPHKVGDEALKCD